MPTNETITAKITSLAADAPEDHPARARVGQDYEVQKSFPATIEEAVEMWGSEVCYSRLRGAVVIDLQSFIRTKIKSKDFAEDSLQSYVDAWGPSQRGPGVSMEQKAENMMSAMSDDDLAKLLASVNERRTAE